MSNDIAALARTLRQAAEEELMCREASDSSDLWQDEAGPENVLALVEALEKAQQQIQAHERANAAQDDHINQQQDRIDTLEKRNAELGGQLSRYSVSPGQADQRTCESRAVRDALGFGKDADNVAPIDLRERIDGMRARIAELEAAEKRIAELDKRLIEYAGIATREARRVAELEARTVTVKLYDDFQLCHYGTTEDYAKGYIDSQNNFTKWLSAAGIKVKES